MKLTSLHKHSLATGVLGLALAPDGDRAFVAAADGQISSVDLATGAATHLAAKHASYASGCVLLPDGQTLVSAGYDGQLIWHDLATQQEKRRVRAHQFWSWQLALSPDGRRLASTTGQYLAGGWKYEPAPETEASVKVFDTSSGELLAAFSHIPPVLSCAFSRDGTHLAAANLLGEVRVWNLAAGANAAPVASWTAADFTSWGSTKSHHYCGGIYSLAFSPDNASLLGCGMGPMTDPMAGNGKMTWQTWNSQTGERINQIRDGQHGAGLMETVAWTPTGSHFVMAGRQAQGTWNAAIFSAADGQLVHSVDTKSRITQARFSADGNQLILAGAISQPQPKGGEWPSWGRVQVFGVEA